MKKYVVVGKDAYSGKTLQCLINAENRVDAINIANIYFRAFDFEESKIQRIK